MGATRARGCASVSSPAGMMRQELWSQLTRSAQQVLTKQAELLVDGHSGTMELHCLNGGVRLLRVGRDYRPADMEYRMGEDERSASLRMANDSAAVCGQSR